MRSETVNFINFPHTTWEVRYENTFWDINSYCHVSEFRRMERFHANSLSTLIIFRNRELHIIISSDMLVRWRHQTKETRWPTSKGPLLLFHIICISSRTQDH
jgi:hypothetical protein